MIGQGLMNDEWLRLLNGDRIMTDASWYLIPWGGGEGVIQKIILTEYRQIEATLFGWTHKLESDANYAETSPTLGDM